MQNVLRLLTAVHQTSRHDVIAHLEINDQSAWVDFGLELDPLSHFAWIAVL